MPDRVACFHLLGHGLYDREEGTVLSKGTIITPPDDKKKTLEIINKIIKATSGWIYASALDISPNEIQRYIKAGDIAAITAMDERDIEKHIEAEIKKWVTKMTNQSWSEGTLKLYKQLFSKGRLPLADDTPEQRNILWKSVEEDGILMMFSNLADGVDVRAILTQDYGNFGAWISRLFAASMELQVKFEAQFRPAEGHAIPAQKKKLLPAARKHGIAEFKEFARLQS